jgi:hypothetical protein
MYKDERHLWAMLTLVSNHIFTESARNIDHENFRQRLDCEITLVNCGPCVSLLAITFSLKVPQVSATFDKDGIVE